MGAEETFGRDHRDVERLHATLREQAERVARELRADGYAGRCVTLKLRFADFSTLTRRHTDDPTQDGLTIYRRARALLDRIPLRQPVRLIGLSVSSLGPATAGQLSLLEPDARRRERLARAMDRVTARFMEHFYAALAAGADAPEALRTARTQLRGETDERGFALAHPAFWSAWFVQR